MLPRVQESVRERTLTLPREFNFGSWSPSGLPNFQREILGVKIQWFEVLFIPLEISWNVNV
jgi:hypothetical protein